MKITADTTRSTAMATLRQVAAGSSVAKAHPPSAAVVKGTVKRQMSPTRSLTRCHGWVSHAVRSWKRR